MIKLNNSHGLNPFGEQIQDDFYAYEEGGGGTVIRV